MKKTLTLACLAATLILGAGPAAASRVDGGQPSDSCTRYYEICFWI
jgi:hypothetical protein